MGLSLVARLLATGVSSLGSIPDISQIYGIRDISKGVASPAHYSPSKKYAKMSILYGMDEMSHIWLVVSLHYKLKMAGPARELTHIFFLQ